MREPKALTYEEFLANRESFRDASRANSVVLGTDSRGRSVIIFDAKDRPGQVQARVVDLTKAVQHWLLQASDGADAADLEVYRVARDQLAAMTSLMEEMEARDVQAHKQRRTFELLALVSYLLPTTVRTRYFMPSFNDVKADYEEAKDGKSPRELMFLRWAFNFRVLVLYFQCIKPWLGDVVGWCTKHFARFVTWMLFS